MEFISSIKNQKIKNLKKLHRRKEREKQQLYMIEGFHLVEEAIKYEKESIINVFITEDKLNEGILEALSAVKNRMISISEEVANEISETETNQGIFVLLSITESPLPEEITRPLLVLDAIQDPGNVGTMIRTADAAGFQGVLLGRGTADLYNSKTIRSAQGSHFHIEVYSGEINDLINKLNKKDLPVYGTALNEAAISYKEIKTELPFALIMGNEGAGVSENILKLTDENLYIPIKGNAESLNVAIAASILMFHLY